MMSSLSLDTKIKLIAGAFIYAIVILLYFIFQPPNSNIAILGRILILVVLYTALLTFDNNPREIFILYSLAMMLTLTFPFIAYCFVAQYTPFLPVDHYLDLADRALGFRSDLFLQWIRHYPRIIHWCEFAYSTIFYQLFCCVVFLGVLGKRKLVRKYLLALLISNTLGALIYFFFPTLDPALLYHDVTFTFSQHQVIQQFQDIHRGITPHSQNLAIIGFPSFHVIWAVTITYYMRKVKPLIYPLILLNVIVIFSTLTTGWHYLADDLGGIAVALLGCYLASLISRRYEKEKEPEIPLWQKEIGSPAPASYYYWFQGVSAVIFFVTCYWQLTILPIVYTLYLLYHFSVWRKSSGQFRCSQTRI